MTGYLKVIIVLGSPTDGFDEPYNGWSHLIFDDGGLKYFIARVDCVV